MSTLNLTGATPVLDNPTYQKYRDEIMMKLRSAKEPAATPTESEPT